MRATIEDEVLFIHHEDLPKYKKDGSIVRNSYFWALRSIAAVHRSDRDWEYESEVWFALQRMLLTFSESRYLRLKEITLEFDDDRDIPDVLRTVSTRRDD
jgi:hypothetical protein